MKKIQTLLIISALLATGCADRTASQTSETITTLADMDGHTLAALSGSVQDLLISKSCPNSTILRSEADADVYLMVETGKAAAMIGSDISWRMAKNGYENIVESGEGFAPQPIGFAFKKENDILLKRFNAFLASYIVDNDVAAIVDEWSNPEGNRKMPVPPGKKATGKLRYAVAAMIPPFNFIKNGEVCGAEAEILAKFAESEGMDWEFIDVAFSGLINFVQSGKADIGASIMCITPERQQSVNFSNPWMDEFSVILVNRKYAPQGEETTQNNKTFIDSVKDSIYKSLVKEDRYKMLLDGLKSTVLISILAAIFGTLLGMLLCYTSMHRNKLLKGISNFYIEFMRCMPQVVFLMIMFYVVFGSSELDGLWIAVIAFSLCFAAYTSVIFRSAVQSIDKGQTEAALSMGFGKVKAFLNIILPQTVQRALPVYKGEFIGLVKATSIVGYIAVFDLTKAGDIIRSRTYEAFFPLILVTIIYFLVIWALTLFLKFIEAKTQPKRNKFFK